MDPGAPIGNAAGAAKTSATLDVNGKARLAKAVKDFEAIFLGYMLNSMRSTVPKDGLSGDSFGGGMMESMFDMEIAKRIASSKSLGIGDMLYRSITKEPLPKSPAPPSRPAPIAPAQAPQVAPAAKVAVSAQTAPGPSAQESVATQGGPPAAILARLGRYDGIIQQAAEKHGVDTSLIKAVIAAESAGDRNALSTKDAKGLMQLTDTTAADMGVKNVWNPSDNINGGVKYLQTLLDRFAGDTTRAVASYNAGPSQVEKHGGVPPIRETQQYVKRVLRYLNFFEKEETGDEER